MKGYVDRIVIDEWAGVHCDEQELRSPESADVLRLFEKLDAKVHTHLCLEGRNGTCLVIGGGAGQYVVYASMADQQFWNLLSQPEASGVVLLTAGGQEGEFPARQVVNKPHALQAALTFFAAGKLDTSLLWEKQV